MGAEPNGQPRAVAVVGTGEIGRSWIRVFARAGYETRAWDPEPEQLASAWEWMKAELKRARKEQGLRKRVVRSEREHVVRCATLQEAVDGVIWVQESGPEVLEQRRPIFAQLDKLTPPKAVLASSTSMLDMTAIAKGLSGANRCVIAHPVNPPHIIPAVEVVGGHRTDPLVLRRAVRFLERLGLTPVLLRGYVTGLLLHRMEAALVREALHLVKEGFASPEAVDAVMRDGLGLRWALMGPFAVGNTSTDGGIREFFRRYRPVFERVCADLCGDLTLTPEVVDQLAKSVDGTWRRVSRAQQRAWRDDMVGRIRHLKEAHPVKPPDPDD
ncbi:MAG TPA: 3-hydroxyacyl-CoA dehydrogenase NAD-binding domain-containing protein [Gemmatimonadales bacterium]